MTIAYLNGEFLPLADAKISVLDRGFIFGDGVYEVAPVYRRRPFFLGAHLRRLAASLAEVQIAPPMEDAQWRQKILSLVSRQNFDDQSVYLQVTRGVAPRKHIFPDAAKPTVFMMCMPLPDNSDKGKKRRRRCDRRRFSLDSLSYKIHFAFGQCDSRPKRRRAKLRRNHFISR